MCQIFSNHVPASFFTRLRGVRDPNDGAPTHRWSFFRCRNPAHPFLRLVTFSTRTGYIGRFAAIGHPSRRDADADPGATASAVG
ncbi:MAG: hypothetical protein ACOYOI_00485 [Chthoniobacterales bacterium]